EPNSMWS
uniref:Conophan vil-M n=1 Tax=Conus villepinii TaxID=257347 RepID=CONOM_CONVL|nr:RecName: Full=Conophan vil-M [Conus villepinii]